MIPHIHDVQMIACDLITARIRVSLLAMVSEIHLFEDVFQNSLTGSVTVLDGAALPDLLPLVGEEYVWVSFQAPQSSKVIQQLLRVVKLTDRQYPTEEMTSYTLHVVGIELVGNQQQRVSRAFQNQPVSEMAEVLIRTAFPGSPKLATLDVEATTLRTDLVIPNMNPFQAINLCGARARSSQDGRANWVFWESLGSGWHWRSLGSVVGQAPVTSVDFVYGNVPTDDPLSLFRHAEALQQTQGFDVLKNLGSGFYGSRVLMHDIIRGGYVVSDSTYLERFGDHPHCGDVPYPLCRPSQMASVDPGTQQFLVPANSLAIQAAVITGADPSIRATQLEQIMEARFRQLVEIRQRVSTLTIPGHPDVEAGTIITIQYPTPRYRLEGNQPSSQSLYYKQPDPYLSGKHLVVAVRHIITSGVDGHFQYRQRLEVSKDCLEQSLPT